jgi:hypothetical protein
MQDKVIHFIDPNGKILFSPDADECWSFSNGLALIRRGAKYGYIRFPGGIGIPLQYDMAQPFENGLAFVESEGKTLVIDINGNRVDLPRSDRVFKLDPIHIVAADDSTKTEIVYRVERSEKGVSTLVRQFIAPRPLSSHVHFHANPSLRVYAPTVWDFETAKNAGNTSLALTPATTVGPTPSSASLSVRKSYAIVFVRDSKPCYVKYWYPGDPDPVIGDCK